MRGQSWDEIAGHVVDVDVHIVDGVVALLICWYR
jgi:hypothetical protein